MGRHKIGREIARVKAPNLDEIDISKLGSTCSTGRNKVLIQIMNILILHSQLVRNNVDSHKFPNSIFWAEQEIKDALRRYFKIIKCKKRFLNISFEYILDRHKYETILSMGKNPAGAPDIKAEQRLKVKINGYFAEQNIDEKYFL